VRNIQTLVPTWMHKELTREAYDLGIPLKDHLFTIVVNYFKAKGITEHGRGNKNPEESKTA
jgi:hypothetical protein